MTNHPTDANKQRVLDLLYHKMHLAISHVQEVKESAVYVESLGIDLSTEADHAVTIRLVELSGLLYTIDILRWTMGYKPIHQNEIKQLEEEVGAQMPHLPTL